jgi:alkanesulfonate monooxygenase SsuD/methylene tetrahydromethanopterin reductase-like flavin-dependent oxidoreductase (luciferase family)
MQFEIKYNLRNPRSWSRPWSQVFGDLLEQVEWADAHGFDRVHLTEHHFAEDGWLSSSITTAAAIAARTQRIKICLNALILPLKHPVQLAEDLFTLDAISKGRLEFVLAAGYRSPEFKGYGIPLSQRPSRVKEGLEVLRACLSGEPFSYSGRYWNLSGGAIAPSATGERRLPLTLGGSSVAAARRAARYADAFAPTNGALLNEWRAELDRLGVPRPLPGSEIDRLSKVAIGVSTSVHLAENVDGAWNELMPYFLEEESVRLAWIAERDGNKVIPRPSAEEIRKSPNDVVLDEPRALAYAKQQSTAPGEAIPRLVFNPMKGGMPLWLGMRSLEIAATKLMPALGNVDRNGNANA